jgi:hypothetical protein
MQSRYYNSESSDFDAQRVPNGAWGPWSDGATTTAWSPAYGDASAAVAFMQSSPSRLRVYARHAATAIALLAGSVSVALLLDSLISPRAWLPAESVRGARVFAAAPVRPGSADPPASVAASPTRHHARSPQSRRQGSAPQSPSAANEPSAVPDMDFTDSARSSLPNGVLRINSRPWSQLFVDGHLVGTTPQLAVDLSAGEHLIRLVNREFGMSKAFRVDVGAGEHITRVETLED